MDVSTLAVIGFFVVIAIAVVIDGIRSLRKASVSDCRRFLERHPEYCHDVCDVCEEENPHRR